MVRLLLSLFLIPLAFLAFSQQFTPYAPPVTVDQTVLPYPWAGGLNKPQFSSIDFDNNGQDDLLVFDREGGAILPFLKTGPVGQTQYTYAPAYAAPFPILRDWLLVRDFNADGLPDLFTNAYDQAPQGIAVYRGTNTGNGLSFERITFPFDFNVLYAQQSNGAMLNLYCSFEDIPAIDDIDNDGDLDILAFEPNGIYTYWYRNRSVEEGYGTDTLLFALEDNCWGGFIEDNFTSGLTLASAPGECADGLIPPVVGSRHAGSSLLTWDLNGDQAKEVLIGDLSNPEMVLLTNGGSPGADWMTSEEQGFPAADVPVHIPIFNAGFNPDVDGDGLFDLLVAPNSGGLAKDVENVWLYLNKGTEQAASFERVEKEFLVGGMIDLGTGAHPAIADVNADGLPDLVVGNALLYEEGGVIDPRLYVFTNTGTPEAPAFELTTDDWLGMSTFGADNRYDFSPTFGDLDSDGDLDLLVGENSGRFFLYENIAGPGEPMEFAAPVYPYANLDIFNSPVPQIVDFNRDGLPDILAGTRFGFLNYFQNTGTPENPQFNPDLNASPNVFQLGGVDTRESSFTTRGYSAPCIIELGGQYELFCGSYRLGLVRYGNIDNQQVDTFAQLNTIEGVYHLGERLHPVMADLNNDGLLEMVIGNRRGGLSMFATNLKTDGTTPVQGPPQDLSIQLYPNPAAERVTITSSRPLPQGAVLQFVTPLGQIASTYHLRSESVTRQVAVSDLPPGLYFWTVRVGDQLFSQGKLIVR